MIKDISRIYKELSKLNDKEKIQFLQGRRFDIPPKTTYG